MGFSRQEYWSGLPFPSSKSTFRCICNIHIWYSSKDKNVYSLTIIITSNFKQPKFLGIVKCINKLCYIHLMKYYSSKNGTSLVVQWLKSYTVNARGTGSIPVRELRSHMLWGTPPPPKKENKHSCYIVVRMTELQLQVRMWWILKAKC